MPLGQRTPLRDPADPPRRAAQTPGLVLPPWTGQVDASGMLLPPMGLLQPWPMVRPVGANGAPLPVSQAALATAQSELLRAMQRAAVVQQAYHVQAAVQLAQMQGAAIAVDSVLESSNPPAAVWHTAPSPSHCWAPPGQHGAAAAAAHSNASSQQGVPAAQPSSASARAQPAAGTQYHGVLKTFSPKDGYGFIACEAVSKLHKRDVYIHKAQLPENASCGCRLSFTLAFNNKQQPQARDVALLDDEAIEAPDGSPTPLLLGNLPFEPAPLSSRGVLPDGSRSSTAVRICSWNILAAAYANCKAFPDVDPSVLRWPRRCSLIRKVINSLHAEVLALQEADRLDDLRLEAYDSVFAQRPDGRADGCLIAWLKGAFTLEDHEVISFDDHPPPEDRLSSPQDALRFRRGNCALIARLRRNGRAGASGPFAVATAHLCWEADCEDVRQWQAEVLLRRLQERTANIHRRAVLCGDFNSMPGSASHACITEAMASIYADVETETITNSNASVDMVVADSPQGDRGRGFTGMLDYMCFDKRGAAALHRLRLPTRSELCTMLGGSAPDGQVPTLLCESWPSDHLPVAAEIAFATGWQ